VCFQILTAKDTAQKHPHRTPEAVVYEKKYHEGQHKNPEHADHHLQQLENKPEQQQPSEKNCYRVFK